MQLTARLILLFLDKEFTINVVDDMIYMIDNNIQFLGRDIVDGDDTDLRFLEPNDIISALYAKGRAKLDGTGFVVDIPEQIKLAA